MKKKSTRAAVEFMARECVGNKLRLLGRVVTSVYEEELRPLKLTPSQMIILAITAQQGRVRAVDLSRLLQMDASTVSRNVERLRARGWIEEACGESLTMSVLEKIEKRAVTLRQFPERGRIVSELRTLDVFLYRELIERPWRIVYRFDDKRVYVLAVLDSRRELTSLLLERLIR